MGIVSVMGILTVRFLNFILVALDSALQSFFELGLRLVWVRCQLALLLGSHVVDDRFVASA